MSNQKPFVYLQCNQGETHKNQSNMKCVICSNEIEVNSVWSEGHNAEPVKSGRCCGLCNETIVIPERLKLIL